MVIRDRLIESVIGSALQDIHDEIGSSLDGLVDYVETDAIRGEHAARARHRIIAQIVWKKCGSRERKEALLQKAMEKINLTYRLDKIVFDLFIRSDEIVDTFSTLEGKVKFFETAAQRDPDNVFVLQHFSRMLLREKKLTLALAQIDSAITKDKTKSIRSLHHTRGLVLAELALTEESDDLARKWLAQSEREFVHCITAKESDDYGHSGLASLYLAWSRRKKLSVDEGAEYLEKAEATVAKGLRVVREKTALLIISSDIQNELGNQPERISKLRQAVDGDSASAIGRYLLARAYRNQGLPRKTIEVLEPIITTDFRQVRAYIEYTRAMLEIGESIKKCAATISQCRLDGESDCAFVGLYGGLLFMDGQYANATKLWEDAKEQPFSYEERTRKQYIPRDPADLSKRMTFTGTIEHAKPGLVLIQPQDGPVLISTQTLVGSTLLQRGHKVSFELTFSAKGPFAEHLQIA